MNKKKKDEFDIYLIETIQDYLNYKQARQRRQEEIDSIRKDRKNASAYSEYSCFAKEDDISQYNSNRNSILIEAALSYIEDMSPSEIDDVKTIQLMLLKLAHGKCDAIMYERIMNVDRMVAKKATNSFKFGYGSNNHIYAGGGK